MTKSLIFYILFLVFLGLTLNCEHHPMKKSAQILKINYFSPPSSFHPHLVSDIRTHSICKALFEGLTRINPDGKIELAAAEHVEISPCKTKYTFTLRSSQWSNRKELTSHHFADSWKQALNPSSKSIHVKRFFLIKNAKKIYDGDLSLESLRVYTPSNTKLIIQLEHPAPYFLELLADPIFSPIYDSDLDREPTIFNGPFLLSENQPQKQITLLANPLYWDAKTVRLKKIEITLVQDQQTALAMYEKGQSNWIGSPFTNISNETFSALSNIQSQKASAPFWIFCNNASPKLRSANIRKALSYALNREDIITHVLPRQKELYTILPKEPSSLSKDSFLTYDLTKAKDLFETALKELGLDKATFQLTLNHSNIPEQEKLASYLKHQWEKVLNIQVILKKDDWNTFYANIKSGNYEIGGFYLFNLYNDPSYLMESFEDSSNRCLNWENESFQQHLDLARQAMDEKKRKEHLEKAEQILMEEMPVIPIYNHTHLYLCKSELENFSAPKFNYADFKWAYFHD